MDNIKVVFVDWYNTLCSGLLFKNISDLDKITCEELQKWFFEDTKEFHQAWMRGVVGRHGLAKLLCENNKRYQYEVVEDLFHLSAGTMRFDRDEYWDLLRQVKASGKQIVLATDNMDFFTDFTVPALKLGELFDAILSSNQMGFLKKDASPHQLKFFDFYLKNQGIKYEEAILFDDTLENIEQCKKYGMNAVHVTKPQDLIDRLTRLIK